jgi:hypothetical protein
MKLKRTPFQFSGEFFLFLLPLFFVFHGFVENYPSALLKDAIYLLFIYQCSVLVFAFITFLFTRSWRKASLFTLFFFFFFFFFGAIHDGLKKVFEAGIITSYTIIIPLLLIIILAGFFFIYNAKKSFHKVVKFSNLLLAILITFDLASLLFSIKSTASPINNGANQFTKCDICKKPDIYLIVADEYAGSKELKDIMNFDNSKFEEELNDRGFHIISNSKSNYNYTPFSAASLLSMQYLKGIEGHNFSKSDRRLCNQKINENDLLTYLKSIGYKIKNYSVFGLDKQQPLVTSQFIATSKELLTRQTLPGRLYQDLGYHFITTLKIKPIIESSIYHQLKSNQVLLHKTINESKLKSDEPRFIYTHLMLPHYPYYFTKEGKSYPFETLFEGNQIRQSAYVDYLQYANKVFLNLIDTINTNSKTPPIIIFMGDHGFRHFSQPVDTAYHFMNFNSILLPDKDYNQFYEGMSSVNLFRVLLNTQFNQHLPLLKDSTVLIND